MATTLKPDSKPPMEREDQDQTTVDLKRLVEALQTLIQSIPPVDPKPKPKTVSRSSRRYLQLAMVIDPDTG
jgi:hypothetical protein